jgi:hypothetical protein
VKGASEKKGKGKEKEKVTTVEVLNPKAVEATSSVNKPTQSSSVETTTTTKKKKKVFPT